MASSAGSDVPEGIYAVEVNTILPMAQPEDVQEVIGKAGERLSGKLVKADAGGKIVSVRTVAMVGMKGAAESASLKRATDRRTALQRALARLDQLERRGRMSPHEFTPECMTRMRADHEALDVVARDLDQMALTLPGVVDLRYASRILQTCVSCADSFVDSCDDGRSKLRAASSAIAAGKLR
jgi:hypothetical protein